MDAACDSEPLSKLERELGHVAIVAINWRGRKKPPTLDEAEKKPVDDRTVVERINSRLRDSFGYGGCGSRVMPRCCVTPRLRCSLSVWML
jgi:hypothetical protein